MTSCPAPSALQAAPRDVLHGSVGHFPGAVPGLPTTTRPDPHISITPGAHRPSPRHPRPAPPVTRAHIPLACLNLPLFVGFALLSAAPSVRAAQPAPLLGLDTYIDSAMAEWELPGLAIAAVKDDSVVYAKGFGVTALGGDEAVDEHTLFAIASTTKAFTTTSLAMLAEDGLLDWDEPVGPATARRWPASATLVPLAVGRNSAPRIDVWKNEDPRESRERFF